MAKNTEKKGAAKKAQTFTAADAVLLIALASVMDWVLKSWAYGKPSDFGYKSENDVFLICPPEDAPSYSEVIDKLKEADVTITQAQAKALSNALGLFKKAELFTVRSFTLSKGGSMALYAVTADREAALAAKAAKAAEATK